MLRMGACLGVAVDIIGPAGFDMSDRALRRSGLDYLDVVELCRHISFAEFNSWRCENGYRLVLASTSAAVPYCDFSFSGNDILMMGRESSGVPDEVRELADAAVHIPMKEGMRSLNVAVSAAMMVGEALRQLRA